MTSTENEGDKDKDEDEEIKLRKELLGQAQKSIEENVRMCNRTHL